MTQKGDLPSLDELERSLDEAQRKLDAKSEATNQTSSQGLSIAYRICIDLLAGVLVGGFIGYQLDEWLETKPIFFVVCFCFGVAGSGFNIYRMVKDWHPETKTPKLK